MKQFADADAAVQRQLEDDVFKWVQTKLSIEALDHSPRLPFPDCPEIVTEPDFYSESAGVIGEIHTHLGKLKSAQRHKVAADILKMTMYEKVIGKTLRKYIVVCSEEEYKQLQGNSHLAYAIRVFDVKMMYYPLNDVQKQMLSDAMQKQDFYTGD